MKNAFVLKQYKEESENFYNCSVLHKYALFYLN